MAYAWIITKDYIEEKDGNGPDVGVMGPRDLDPAAYTGKGEAFAMYDDDGILYYRGRIVGDYDGFEPLDDFGMPNAGCTGIKYRNPSTNKWEWL